MVFRNRPVFCFATVVAVCVLALFGRSVRFGYMTSDDPEYVINNEIVHDGLTARGFVWAFTDCGYASNWHPAAWLSLMADVSVAKKLTPGELSWSEFERSRVTDVIHAHNVLLHVANAVLLFLLLHTCTKGRLDPIWPLFAALFWALHPLRVEVVCWVAERKELLSVFFMLSSLLCSFTPGTRHQAPRTTHHAPTTLLSLLFFALALLAKPVAVTLPAVILAWDWIFNGKVRWHRLIPFGLLSGATCVLTMMAQGVALDTAKQLDLVQRLTSVFVGPLIYIRQTFWPVGLSLMYPNTLALNCPALAAGIAFAVLLVALGVWWVVRRVRAGRQAGGFGLERADGLDIVVFGISWAYVGLIPMLGLVKVGSQEHNDRYTYWVGCGAVAAAVLLLAWAKPYVKRLVARSSANTGHDEWPSVRRLAAGAAAGAMLVLFCLSDGRVTCWGDPVELYRDTVLKSWHQGYVIALARNLERKGGPFVAEAEQWLREGVTQNPCRETYSFLAFHLVKHAPPMDTSGLTDVFPLQEAEFCVDSALEIDPTYSMAVETKKVILAARKEFEARRRK